MIIYSNKLKMRRTGLVSVKSCFYILKGYSLSLSSVRFMKISLVTNLNMKLKKKSKNFSQQETRIEDH